ncbi:MAG: hypothetical protein NVS3B10_05000 [Polyangiales bacterium]
MSARGASLLLWCVLGLLARPAHADDAGRPSACTESIPAGASRPTLVEKVPTRAKAGELVELEIAVRHGAGEEATLPADLPGIIKGLGGADAPVRIADDGSFGRGAAPKAAPDPGDPAHATTLLKIPFVVLSTSIPRATFILPPVRVIVLRKGGGDLAVCTAPHEVAVDQPIASTPDPLVRTNPPAVAQVTRDERLQELVTWAALALLAGAALMAAYLLWWRRRPKTVPAPPPPPSPWVVAVAELHAARDAYVQGSVAAKPYFDRISDAVRAARGPDYGDDALARPPDETLGRLRGMLVPVPRDRVAELLGACDLVKFAGMSASVDEGIAVADLGLHIVRVTSHSGGMTIRERAALVDHPFAGSGGGAIGGAPWEERHVAAPARPLAEVSPPSTSAVEPPPSERAEPAPTDGPVAPPDKDAPDDAADAKDDDKDDGGAP